MHWFSYIPWLLWQIIVGAFTIDRDAIRNITKLHPTVVRYPLRVTQPRLITILSLSITMTPGTMTIGIELDEDEHPHLIVHSVWGLDPHAIIDDIADMEERMAPHVRSIPLSQAQGKPDPTFSPQHFGRKDES